MELAAETTTPAIDATSSARTKGNTLKVNSTHAGIANKSILRSESEKSFGYSTRGKITSYS